jgi:hypothetical protein
VTKRAALVLVLSAAARAVAADPSTPPEAPSEELLEYLGTWDGDEDWLHSGDLLPRERGANQDPGNREEKDRVQPREPVEQEK